MARHSVHPPRPERPFPDGPHPGPVDEPDDDRPIGRILSRREVLALLGWGGMGLLAGCTPLTAPPEAAPSPAGTTPAPSAREPAIPSVGETGPEATNTAPTATPTSESLVGAPPLCVVRPETTEGPYFVDARLHRADIRSDPVTGEVKEGALLELTFRISQIGPEGCTPLPGALVDVWHCDALGAYSGVADPRSNARDQLFLRGYQLTDEQGQASFITIYPGWYPGRTVHIHFKVRLEPDAPRGYDFTSQLFFDENLTDQIHAREPYARRGRRNTFNHTDRIFREELLLDVQPTAQGYRAVFDLALDLTA